MLGKLIRRILAGLASLGFAIVLVDEIQRTRHRRTIHSRNLYRDQQQFLERLVDRHGEGFSVYTCDDADGFNIIPGSFRWLDR